MMAADEVPECPSDGSTHDRACPHFAIAVDGVVERREAGEEADTETGAGTDDGPDDGVGAAGRSGLSLGGVRRSEND
jgi:hypothetical protein